MGEGVLFGVHSFRVHTQPLKFYGRYSDILKDRRKNKKEIS